MKNTSTYISICLVAALATAAACSTPPPSKTPVTPALSASASASAAPAEQAPSSKGLDGKTERVASTKLVDRRANTALATDTLDNHAKSADVPKTSTEIYKQVAPATVIIRVGGGMGSGIIVDPAGWVLTNHHVIRSGRGEAFTHKATVLLGKLSDKSGAVERTGKEYEAYVYKADKLRDIALLKIKDPPKDLPFIKLAAKKPAPGNSVIAIGHAGAGMLWALKSGQISALGKLTEHLAAVASFKNDAAGKRKHAKFKKFVESKNLGMVIQSTCNILPGDSGGPLVNDRGELIGLNVFTKRDRRTGGQVSFHVHLNELKPFAEARPKAPVQMVPNPWSDGGADLSYEDADIDGKVDVLMLQGRKPCFFCPRQSTAAFIDADQSSFKGREALPKLQDVFDKKDFDAEVVYLQLRRDVLVWYDTDDDGRFDVLLHDVYPLGRINAGYRIAADGTLTKDDKLSRGRPFQPKLLEKPSLRARFSRVTHAAFPSWYTDAPKSSGGQLPVAIPETGRGKTMDLDRNRKRDAIATTSAFSKGLLIDADQEMSGFGYRFKMKDLKGNNALDPEIAIVSQASQMWVFYDTDDDKRFDLVLHSPGSRLYVAKNAWKLDADGKRTRVAEHVGRKLIRPKLLASSAHQDAVKGMVKRGLLKIMSAQKDDGLDSFPNALTDHRGAGYRMQKIYGARNAVVSIAGRGSEGYLVDLDRNSRFAKYKKGDKKGKIDVRKTLRPSKKEDKKKYKFDAEFAYFARNGVAWVFYDTNRRIKGYDLVLISTNPKSGLADAGFRIDKKGKATYDEKLKGKMIRPKAFKGFGARAKFKKIAPELFKASMIEE